LTKIIQQNRLQHNEPPPQQILGRRIVGDSAGTAAGAGIVCGKIAAIRAVGLPRQIGEIWPEAVLIAFAALAAADGAGSVLGAILLILAGFGSAAAAAGHTINSINSVYHILCEEGRMG